MDRSIFTSVLVGVLTTSSLTWGIQEVNESSHQTIEKQNIKGPEP